MDLVLNHGWLVAEETSPSHLLSVVVSLLSNHNAYHDYCKTKHADMDPQKCALIYGFFRKYDEYDNISINRGPDFKIPDYIEHIDLDEIQKAKEQNDKSRFTASPQASGSVKDEL